MYGAWDALPAALQQRIEGLRVKHDGTYNSGGYVRAGRDADRRSAHVARHAASARVASTRKPAAAALYLGRRRNAYIEGLPLEESDALLDEIWRHATR